MGTTDATVTIGNTYYYKLTAQNDYGARTSHTAAMVDGIFQGANKADFSDSTTIYAIDNEPTSAT